MTFFVCHNSIKKSIFWIDLLRHLQMRIDIHINLTVDITCHQVRDPIHLIEDEHAVIEVIFHFDHKFKN